MIVEHAVLQVKPGEGQRFEQALKEALPLIAASPGFLGLEVRPHCDDPQRYLLLVRWQARADHTEGFRRSERYRRWKALLHPFYEPFPVVEHFGPAIASA